MASQIFAKNLKDFLSIDKNQTKQIFYSLSELRKNIEWPRDKRNIIELQKSEALGKIIFCLDSGRQSMLGITLSILANCCMIDSFAEKLIFKHNLFVRIANLLKVPIEEDSTNGRIFRLVGNLCQHHEKWENKMLEQTPKILTYMVNFLKNYSKDNVNISDATIRLTVRALRHMLNSQTLTILMNHETPKVVGALLIKYSVEWEMEKTKERKEVLTCIIKLLLQFSKYKHRPLIEELKNTERGNSIMHLGRIVLVSPKKVVKLIMNLIDVSNLKSDLPIPKICDGFTEALRDLANLKECRGQYMEYIKCLCYLLEHPANRNSSRCKNTIPQLIKVMDKFKENTEDILESCLIIVNTFSKCSYHPLLITEQLEHGAVPVLMQKLCAIVDPLMNQYEHHAPDRRRRRRNCPASSMSAAKSPCLVYSPQRPSSPSSESDSDLSYRCPSLLDVPSDYDSDSYSPLCSDDDAAELDNDRPSEHGESDSDYEGLAPAAPSPLVDDSALLKFRLVRQIVRLFRDYANVEPPAVQLFCEQTVRTLIKCSVYLEEMENTDGGNNTANGLIWKMLRKNEFLLSLLQTDIPQIVEKLYWRQHQICNKCDFIKSAALAISSEMSSLAALENNSSRIANVLLAGTADSKRQLALNVPFVVCDLNLLQYLMLHCGGLKTLLSALKSGQSDLSIHSICLLSKKTLKYTRPKKPNKLTLSEYKLDTQCADVVTFKLDDGFAITVDRTLMCEKSDYFDNLLNGPFCESGKLIIELRETDSKAFRCVMSLLVCDKLEVCELDYELETVLEAISLSDRYLLNNVFRYVVKCVRKTMTWSTASAIYKWSITSKIDALRSESLLCALIGARKITDKIVLVKDLLKTGREELIVDLEGIFENYLKK